MKRITTNPKRTIGPALLSLGIAWATLFFAPRAFGWGAMVGAVLIGLGIVSR